MGRTNPLKGPGDNFSRIRQLAAQLNENSEKLQKSGRWTADQASEHVKIHKQFEKAVDDLKAQQTDQKEFPKDIDVSHILEESNKLIGLFKDTLNEDDHSEVARKSSSASLDLVKPFDLEDEKDTLTTKGEGVLGMSLEEVEKALRSLPPMTEKQLPKESIESAFKEEMSKKGEIERELKKIILDLGVDIKDISNQDLKILICCLLINRNVSRTTTREKAQAVLFQKLLPYVFQKIKGNKGYDTEVEHFQQDFLKLALISEETASKVDSETGFSIQELTYLYSKLENKDSFFSWQLERKTNTLLKDRFSEICHHIKSMSSPETQLDEVEKSITDAMGILNFLSKSLPVTDETEEVWMELHGLFHEIIGIKYAGSQIIQDVISKVFEQFETFIEDGILTYLIIKGGGSAEHTAQQVYGRTEAGLEKIKIRNRKAVAKKILEMAKLIRDGAPITVDMLCELHRINNRNIVPKIASELRQDTNMFGRRVGLLPEDLRPALEDIFQRANQILKRDEGWGIVTYFTTSVEIAALHNEILDIHPYVDRNGSTALLFIELMMTAKNKYTPSPERSVNYYRHLKKILNNSILGPAIVASEHFRIAYVPGHYESRAVELTEEKRTRYQKLLNTPL